MSDPAGSGTTGTRTQSSLPRDASGLLDPDRLDRPAWCLYSNVSGTTGVRKRDHEWGYKHALAHVFARSAVDVCELLDRDQIEWAVQVHGDRRSMHATDHIPSAIVRKDSSRRVPTMVNVVSTAGLTHERRRKGGRSRSRGLLDQLDQLAEAEHIVSVPRPSLFAEMVISIPRAHTKPG
jgi:hypothetical protein